MRKIKSGTYRIVKTVLPVHCSFAVAGFFTE